MQGYYWAETPEKAQLIVLIEGQKGYVAGVENAIPLDELFILEPVKWPERLSSPGLPPQKLGVPAPAATRECAILPFVGKNSRAC